MHTYADCMYIGYINILNMASGLQRTFVSVWNILIILSSDV